MPAGSPLAARMLLVLAAVLWSLGSLFMRLLKEPTPLGLHEPHLSPVQVAFWRGLFAGAALLPLVRPRDVKYQPLLFGMVGCFAVMSGLYLSALGLGNAANAIFLQNSAPVWVYVVGVYLLGQTADARLLRSTVLAAVGVIVIVAGNWPRDLPPEEQSGQIAILAMATGSGVMYAGVVLFLNFFRRQSPAFLMVLNLIGSSVCLGVFVGGAVWVQHGWEAFVGWFAAPSLKQLAFLSVFGALQMAAPYWLFARGLRTLSAQEAGIITLLEPVLNPVWAYLISNEVPTAWTALGGAVLLLALLWRYVPGRRREEVLRPEGPPSLSPGQASGASDALGPGPTTPKPRRGELP